MNARGFTLLEAMVTLVIIALVATLLMQSLAHVLAVRERVLRHERDARVAALHERWFRDSVAAAAADRPGEAPAFRGDASTVAFLTLDAVRAGGAAPIAWRLVDANGGREVVYVEDGQRWPLVGSMFDGARFAYLDGAGRWHDAWPVADQPAAILPRAVRLTWRAAEGEHQWLANVGPGPALPPVLGNRMEQVDGTF